MDYKEPTDINQNRPYPKVGIIILNWNGMQETLACLESLERLSYPSYQIFMVDNGSTDGSVEMLQELESIGRLKLYSNSENLGYTGGNNQGIKAALQDGCDYIWLLNNDTIVCQDSLSHLVRRAESDVKIGMASPVMTFLHDVSLFDESGCRIDLESQTLHYTQNPEVARGWVAEWPNLFLLSGTALLVKRQVVEDIGYLDDRFFAYYEDRDFCLRAIRMGYRAIVEHESRISHSSLAPKKRHWYYFMCRNYFLFWFKHRPDRWKIHHLWLSRRDLTNLMGMGGALMENRISLMEGLVDAFLGRTGRWKRGRVVPVISFWLAGFSLLYHNSKTVVRRLSL